ncbi:hypothetical protein [Bacillus niameyensis]|nr:hypothetical protein [Bacillus niameyensis]
MGEEHILIARINESVSELSEVQELKQRVNMYIDKYEEPNDSI